MRYEGTCRDVARVKEQWKRIKATDKKEFSEFSVLRRRWEEVMLQILLMV